MDSGQTQLNLQHQGGSSLGHGNVVTAERNNLAREKKYYSTMVNNELSYEAGLDTSVDVCDNANLNGFCILSFTGCCNNNSTILVGGLCYRHNIILKHCIYALSGGSLRPFAHNESDRAKYTFFLTSMLSKETKDSIMLQLQYASMDTIEKQMIADFFSYLSFPSDMLSQDNETTFFRAYLLEIKTTFAPLIRSYGHLLNKINVELIFSTRYLDKISENLWVRGIIEDAAKKDRDPTEPEREVIRYDEIGGNFVSFLVPLIRFNIIDILTILSYHVDTTPNEPGLSSNCNVTNGSIVYGSGQGIHNSYEKVSSSINCILTEYTAQQRSAISNSTIPQINNVDILVLASKMLNSKSDIRLRLPISVAGKPSTNFNINLTRLKN